MLKDTLTRASMRSWPGKDIDMSLAKASARITGIGILPPDSEIATTSPTSISNSFANHCARCFASFTAKISAF